jgi:hypothetical protein
MLPRYNQYLFISKDGIVQEYGPPLQIKGRYKVVALVDNRDDEQDDKIIAYAVSTLEGARLFHGMSYDEAQAWMHMRVDEDEQELEKAKRAAGKVKRSRR